LGTGLAWLAQRPVSSWEASDASPAALLGRWLLELGAASLGAFTGCLWATAVRERLWEDNAPPPAEIQAAVRKMHQQASGAGLVDPPGKRIFDLLLAWFGLLLSTPVWLLSLFLVWFEDPGPVLFVKNSVGRGGRNFHQYKIRSMVREAEQLTGPVLSQEGDERVLWIGRLLRKTALDELPQLLNILGGEMSFVGPRPQRTVLVYEYLQRMPEYSERHRVRPGLAGLAQVAGDYFLTPRQKLRFDRLYIRHASLGFDLKLISLAFLITFGYRWKKNWNGRIPRRWLHRR
jgi:lipopolysaccharide/colanic/teichoic acid biosynthesis glycosyltransferase